MFSILLVPFKVKKIVNKTKIKKKNLKKKFYNSRKTFLKKKMLPLKGSIAQILYIIIYSFSQKSMYK